MTGTSLIFAEGCVSASSEENVPETTTATASADGGGQSAVADDMSQKNVVQVALYRVRSRECGIRSTTRGHPRRPDEG